MREICHTSQRTPVLNCIWLRPVCYWKIPAGWQALELPAGESRGMTVGRRGVMNFVYDPT